MKLFAIVSVLVLATGASSAKSLRATPITDDELLTLSRDLHTNDVNGATLTLDLQGQTTAGSLVDNAPGRLIVSDPIPDFAKPTFAAAQALLNNYQKNVTIQDTFTPEQLAEEVAFIDAVMETGVMQQLHAFLVSKGEASADVAEFKQFLSTIWFGRWSEYVPGVVASSGWEHANVFERLENNVIVGFHSWIYLFNEEEDGDLNYLGYINTIETGKTTVLSMPVDLYGSTKAFSEFNMGASPELDLAIGTLCYVARPDVPCFIQGSNGVQFTWDLHTVTYNGVKYVESSHPTFEE
ncbi:poly(U)-specific endoribonuclease homolog [Daphnia magna]|uniref:EndoU domain-containing protein n=1 Tax=Daphnia magna TaxID=35525 RepID=A0A0N8BSM2_9CRUS|nr:poly(U)-specific endoribonuclease homolog [Daphnia magna]KAK4020583.1 hypothetical protein OUZ56_002548 [Daphnia magna]